MQFICDYQIKVDSLYIIDLWIKHILNTYMNKKSIKATV